MDKYFFEFSTASKKQLHKIDNYQQKVIRKWVSKNLLNSANPRQHGKALSGSLQRYWAYRVGNYRIVCEIDDENKTIHIITIGHRSDIYDKIIREEDTLYERDRG